MSPAPKNCSALQPGFPLSKGCDRRSIGIKRSFSLFKISVLSSWSSSLTMGDNWFSTHLSFAEANAVLARDRPYPELLTFPGPKAWYCCEARGRKALFESVEWSTFIAQLKPEEMLYHAHPDLRYRVP